jgi:hypothetical protein
MRKKYFNILILVVLFLWAKQALQLQNRDVAAEFTLPLSQMAKQALQLQHADASDFTWVKIATFDSQDYKTDLGGNISLWPDSTAGKLASCTLEYTDKEKQGPSGYSLKIAYDIDAAKDGATGIKIDLEMPDLAKGHYNLVFLVKGDKEEGHTTKFKVKLESAKGSAIKIAEDITSEWKQVYLPFSMFEGDIDWYRVNTMYIIFDKDTVTEKKGIIYIDAIFLN